MAAIDVFMVCDVMRDNELEGANKLHKGRNELLLNKSIKRPLHPNWLAFAYCRSLSEVVSPEEKPRFAFVDE